MRGAVSYGARMDRLPDVVGLGIAVGILGEGLLPVVVAHPGARQYEGRYYERHQYGHVVEPTSGQ